MLSRRPLALSLLGRLREIHGEWEAASRTYNEALGLLPRGGRRAELLSLLAQAHIRRGEYGAGERTCVETLGQPGRKPARLRGRILCLLGVSAGELGRLDEAEKRFREAIRIFRRVGDAAEEARALSLMAANVLFYRGDYRRAKDLGRQALVIFQRLRDQRRICHTMMGIGLHAAAAGEEREARDLAERALRIAESLEYRMAEGYCHHALGRCALLSRNPEGARRHFERARRLGEQLGEQSLLTWPRLGCAEAHLLEGNRRGARTIAEEILGRTRRGKSPYMEGRAYTILGLSEPRSSPREAANWWRRAERIFREIGALYRLHEILLLRLAAGDVSRRKEPEKIQELLAGCASLDHRFLLTDHGADHAAAVLPRAILLDVETDFAAGVLAAIGERAVPHVEAAIARADERARMRCIEVLARIGGRRAHRVLECAGRSGSAAGRAARDAARDLDAAPAVPLRVHALGSCHVWIGDVLIERDRWRSARAARLFQFLLVQRARWVPRDVLIEALWPGADPSRAENNLRQSIHLLRKTLEPELVETRHSRYVLFRGEACKLDLGEGGQSDIESFERLIREADRRLDEGRHRKAERALREAIDLYKGDLLEESPYEEFLAAAREDLRDRHLRALEKLVRLLDANRRHEEIVPICRRGLSRDPYSEDFAWHLIHALLRLGNRREAIEAYHRYEKLLVQELDVLPSQRMKALAAQATALRPGSRRGAASEAQSQSPPGALLDGNGLADR